LFIHGTEQILNLYSGSQGIHKEFYVSQMKVPFSILTNWKIPSKVTQAMGKAIQDKQPEQTATLLLFSPILVFDD